MRRFSLSRVRGARALIAALVTVGVATVGFVGTAPTASAASVGMCNPWWGTENPYVCVGAQTGQKNLTNRTQWVSTVTVRTTLNPGRMEAWIGNGPSGVAWFGSVSGATYRTWTVNRWVKNGSGICGAYYHRFGGRSVACITIKV